MAIDLRGLHGGLRPSAEWCMDVFRYYTGQTPVVTSVYRDWEKQKQLRSRYETCLREGRFPDADCRYPANRPGDSAHNFALAFDSVVAPELQDFWDYVRRYAGFRVPENDRIHAELPNWRDYSGVRPY